ncbi:transcription factor TFIIIC subunit tfc4 [Globomyces sp. JEL0801]|nr:transcription factor TFIIIC subunit tfc4 [Globomyces sp. JEL0801]
MDETSNTTYPDINLDQVLRNLTDSNDGPQLHEVDDDELPDGFQNLVNNAMQGAGIAQNYDQLIFEENQHPTMESDIMDIEQSLEPDADKQTLGTFVNFNPSKSTRKYKRKRKTIINLPDHLADVLRDANWAYVIGDKEESKKLCHEILSERPDAHSVWQLMGMIARSENNLQKELEYNLMAVTISSEHNDLWKSLALLSNPTLDILWDEAMLYRELNHPMAEKKFRAFLNVYPNDQSALKEIAKINIDNGQNVVALEILESLFTLDADSPLENEVRSQNADDSIVFDEEIIGHISLGCSVIKKQRINYEELLLISKIYMDKNDFDTAVQKLKIGIARLHGYPTENINFSSDQEYSSRRYDIPLEIRVKLGICRLYLKDTNAANNHFSALYECEINLEFSGPLFYDVGIAYMNCESYMAAIQVLKHASFGPDALKFNAFKRMAECYIHMADYNSALEMYNEVLNLDPNDIECQHKMIQLHEELGEEEEANELLEKFQLQEEMRNRFSYLIQKPQRVEEQGSNDDSGALLKGLVKDRKIIEKAKVMPDKALALQEKRERENANMRTFENVKKLSLELDNPSKRVREGDQLRGHRIAVGGGPDIHMFQDELQNPRTLSNIYSGISFYNWYELFLQYARMMAEDHLNEECQKALKYCFEATVFYEEKKLRMQMRFLIIACAIYNHDFERVQQSCRWFCQESPFLVDSFRLYYVALSGTLRAAQTFYSSPNTKYFQRMNKKLLEDSHSSPMDNEVAAHQYTLTGHLMLGSKSYATCINFYLKARKLKPDDPIINLCLGISYLHRGCQKSESRHDHIIRVILIN